ncbi:MAG: DUF1189 family protein [Candidatus Omnitrophica bacterium]|nr:DUF1189 family protein [Candidatus Omnitrophota bacterium]MDD5671761.1 DUF1189 family protein [Candidatus Omnitrophota bacterium]
MNILTAPVYSLFSIAFYRQVIREHLGKGFLYVVYLSLITAVIITLMFVLQVLPLANPFVDWLQAEMPTITMSPDGLAIDRPSPLVLTHPTLGPIAIFDMDKKDVNISDIKDVYVYVTQTKLFVRQRSGELRVYDLAQAMAEGRGRDGNTQPSYLTPESVKRFYNNLKPWVVILLAVICFIAAAVLTLFWALIYSWFGLIFNMSRNPKLTFGEVYHVSLYAMTAATVYQWLRMLIPVFGKIPLGFLTGFLLTIFYLFLAIKKTQETPEIPAV